MIQVRLIRFLTTYASRNNISIYTVEISNIIMHYYALNELEYGTGTFVPAPAPAPRPETPPAPAPVPRP